MKTASSAAVALHSEDVSLNRCLQQPREDSQFACSISFYSFDIFLILSLVLFLLPWQHTERLKGTPEKRFLLTGRQQKGIEAIAAVCNCK